MTPKDCRLTSPIHPLRTAVLLLSLCVVAAHAQSRGGLTGDVSYTRGGGSGG